MNRLLAALMGSVFAFASASAIAQSPSTQPIVTTGPGFVSKMSTEEAKKAKAEAKAKWDKMTPDEKAAVKKGMAKKHQDELTAMEAVAGEGDSVVYDAKKGAELAKDSKAQPVPTKAERQKDLKAQEKGATGQ